MIKSIKGREILNSRGKTTIEVELETNKGVFKSSVPSGASTGKNEAKAVSSIRAIKNLKLIEKEIKGLNEKKQKKIDDLMIRIDSTDDKSYLGANTMLAVSIAICRAGAKAKKKPLYKYIKKLSKTKGKLKRMPRPCFNVINGGAHAGNDLDVQEFMIIPPHHSFRKNLKEGAGIYQKLKKIIRKKYGEQSINLGDEGGFSPDIAKDEKALDLLKKIIGKDIKIGLDVAASQFFKDNQYYFERKQLTSDKLLDFYSKIVKKYPIEFIEDPFDEEDWSGFKKAVSKLKVTIVGDDLLTTNTQRMRLAHAKDACNGIIIKPNQIGTVTETLEAIKLAKLYKWKIIISHRSGETLDDFIADLAVGVQSDYIKSGAPARGERLAKYNRLLKIEEELF